MSDPFVVPKPPGSQPGSSLRRVWMVSDVVHGPDGLSVVYGPGELWDINTLPAGVPYREVLVSPAQEATAPPHATQT